MEKPQTNKDKPFGYSVELSSELSAWWLIAIVAILGTAAFLVADNDFWNWRFN